jgi:formate hydrogenlyase subunit 3/multisubunit Na+/H+ antiporter MnhD subunit
LLDVDISRYFAFQMGTFGILAPVFLSFLILIFPDRFRFRYTLALTLSVIALTTVPAVSVFVNGGLPFSKVVSGSFGSLVFTIDSLSGFFILVTNFTMFTGLLYSRGYLDSYRSTKSAAQFGLHNFSYVWLHLSMLAVLMLRGGLPFLIAWELMAVSSFMLILFEAEQRATLKTAVNYLIQMHVGLVILIIAFLVLEARTGVMSFDALKTFFSGHNNTGLFFLFFAGFAIKAGFVPFHTWLPEAHPAAPSHVSGVMSGVMIKMGIYGIVRVLTAVQSDFYIIGIVILVVSSVTGLYGIMMAIVQTDLKKMLAYSTIENVGIIGIGIGLGCIGLGLSNPALTLLGFGGGLLHVLNHSLFKSLLFYGSGSVYKVTHTRNMEELGGLIHRMPRTAGLFLFGSMAISALPPLNGFISELLIYYGLFEGLDAGSVFQSISMLLVILSMALIGGLSLFGFSKAFGITFLGVSRASIHFDETGITPGMLFPKLLIAAVILAAGLAPMLFLSPVLGMIASLFKIAIPGSMVMMLIPALSKVSLIGMILIMMVILIMALRRIMLKPRKVSTGPTWGCGYTAGTARQQYTATSWSGSFAELANPILRGSGDLQMIHPEDLFPAKRSFNWRPRDIFGSAISWLTGMSMLGLKKIARLQTGNIQHYILYAFVFILIIFILLYLNIV